jgi:hypothetical protein
LIWHIHTIHASVVYFDDDSCTVVVGIALTGAVRRVSLRALQCFGIHGNIR